MKKFIISLLFVFSAIFNVYGSDEPAKKKAKTSFYRTDDDQRIMTPTIRLYIICRANFEARFNMAPYSIAEGADVNYTDSYGFTPMYYAAARGNKKLIKQLHDSGKVDMDIRYGADQESILHVATLGRNSKETVRCLLKLGVPIDSIDKDGENAAHYAMTVGEFGIANLLAERGIDLLKENKDGKRPVDCLKNKPSNQSEYLLNKQIRALAAKQARKQG